MSYFVKPNNHLPNGYPMSERVYRPGMQRWEWEIPQWTTVDKFTDFEDNTSSIVSQNKTQEK